MRYGRGVGLAPSQRSAGQPGDRRIWIALGLVGVLVGLVVVWQLWPESADDNARDENTVSNNDAANGSQDERERPPAFPVAARQMDQAGARTAAIYYFDALNYFQRTGDSKPIRRVVDMNQCTRCATLIETLESDYANGYRAEGGDYSDVNLSDPRGQQLNDDTFFMVFTVSFHRNEGVVRNQSGAEVDSIEAGRKQRPYRTRL